MVQLLNFLIQQHELTISNAGLITVEPRYFEVPSEIAGLRNNRGSVKEKGKSKGIRSSFEIAGTSN